MTITEPFAQRVADGMRRSGLTLRSFCREVGLDPSFFSKVLSGKRSPPSEEEVLRRIAARLALDPAELIVAAGRIPSEWRALWRDPQLFTAAHQLVSGRSPRVQAQTRSSPVLSKQKPQKPQTKAEPHPSAPPPRPQHMSEELL